MPLSNIDRRGIQSGGLPKAMAISSEPQPKVKIRCGSDGTVVDPNACSTVTGNDPDRKVLVLAALTVTVERMSAISAI
jgi:hypothetical protein